MIFYFSGTGNSQALAVILAEHLGDQAINIIGADPSAYHFTTQDYLGFVFPVYAYAAPQVMLRFAEQIAPGQAFTFAVCTFSNVTGLALEHFSARLALKSGYGIKMPDNYPVLNKILETKETARQKLLAAKTRLEEVFLRIQAREEGVFDTLVGEDGYNRSYNLSAQFDRFKRKTAPYRAEKHCISCGLCEKLCPAQAIQMQEEKPVWIKEDCYMCMACLNRCPVEAIQYGEFSSGQYRYYFTGFDL